MYVGRYLGVSFDHKMIWNKHIEHLTSKTKYFLFILCPFSKYLCSYGIIAWGGAYKTALFSLQYVQNRILKSIFRKTAKC